MHRIAQFARIINGKGESRSHRQAEKSPLMAGSDSRHYFFQHKKGGDFPAEGCLTPRGRYLWKWM